MENLEKEKATEKDFFRYTVAVFTTAMPNIRNILGKEPDFTSESGSKYWYTDEGVYRMSDHWGEVKTCVWVLHKVPKKRIKHKNVLGFCKWENFSYMREYLLEEKYRGEYCGTEDTPVIPEDMRDECFLAFEFGEFYDTIIDFDNRIPIDEHPNHKSDFINIVENFDYCSTWDLCKSLNASRSFTKMNEFIGSRIDKYFTKDSTYKDLLPMLESLNSNSIHIEMELINYIGYPSHQYFRIQGDEVIFFDIDRYLDIETELYRLRLNDKKIFNERKIKNLCYISTICKEYDDIKY